MEEAWEAVEEGAAKAVTFGAGIHIALGLSILALGVWRLLVRRSRGAPPPPETEAPGLRMLALGVHVLLYVLMIGLPIGGFLAWASESEAIAGMHGLGTKVLFGLVALHVLGAAYNQWVLKNGLIGRMMRPE
jgi:cytochrome b561